MNADGYDFEPVSDGTFLMEIVGEDGKTFTYAVLSAEAMRDLPKVVTLVLAAAANPSIHKRTAEEAVTHVERRLKGGVK